MKLLRTSAAAGRCRSAGSALLLSFLVLIVLAAIVFQLHISTNTDSRVARNDVALVTMDQAIESALLEVYDRLLTDAEGGAGGTGPAPVTGGPEMPGEEGGGEQTAAVDSHEDSWGRPQRTTINELELRVLVQDEDSKLNVLGMLTEDEDQAELAFERVVRVLDYCREDTREDIDRSDARRMAESIRDHLRDRMRSELPKPTLLSDDEDDQDVGLPLTLKEFLPLEGFHEGLFRDYRDEDGTIVHSIESFLTVWTSLTTNEELTAMRAEAGSNAAPAPEPPANPENPENPEQPATEEGEEGPGKAGIAVNLNTAPRAVLMALIDDRDVPHRFWDDVVEYRNLEEEDESGEQAEPVLDEYGEEIIQRRVFDSVSELEQVKGWGDIGPEERDQIKQLTTTESQVFSLYVTARRATGQRDSFGGYRGARRSDEQEDQLGNALVRTVRSVVWRYNDGEEWRLVPLVRWEVLDYTPFEVQDFPEEGR